MVVPRGAATAAGRRLGFEDGVDAEVGAAERREELLDGAGNGALGVEFGNVSEPEYRDVGTLSAFRSITALTEACVELGVPDLIAVGKSIGGGLPLGAFGGTDEYIAKINSMDELPMGETAEFIAQLEDR